jgi:hypothetical protein
MVPRALVDQAEIQRAVRRAERDLARDVVRIMYSFGTDWTGEVSLFFRVLLADRASAPSRLRQNTKRITDAISRAVKAEELGVQTYFNFRSKSEQEKLREPFWERP